MSQRTSDIPPTVPGHVDDPSSLRAQDVSFPGAGGEEIRGYLVHPAGPGPHPGLIVIHEAMGLNEHIRDVARRFANIGYLALAPDLYTREGDPPQDFPSIMRLMQSLPDARTVGDLEGAADLLRGLAGCSGRVGCIGFCSGGRQTLLLACSSDRLHAAVDCWGGYIHRASAEQETTPNRPVPVIDMVARLGCPLMVAIGAEDANPSPEIGAELRRRLEDVPHPSHVDVYDGAGHAFFADHRPNYRPEAAHRLWEHVVPFLSEHLGPRR